MAETWIRRCLTFSAVLAACGAPLNDLQREYDTRREADGPFFDGSSHLLKKILELREKAGKMPKLSALQEVAAACISDKDFGCCSANLGRAHSKVRGAEKKQLLFEVVNFCDLMAKGDAVKETKKGLNFYLDAMAIARQHMDNTLLKAVLGKDAAWMLKSALFRTHANVGGWPEMEQPPNLQSANFYVPGLTTRPMYSPSSMPAAKTLEREFDKLRTEILAFMSNEEAAELWAGRNETETKLTASGKWNEIPLYNHGVMQSSCEKFFPITCKLIEDEIPEVWTNTNGLVSISVLEPGTVVKEHSGRTNSVLTIQLAITAPEGAGIFVGGEERTPGWIAGKATIFDDSFPHSVWHHGSHDVGPRIVLLLRVIHPDFTIPERLVFMRKKYQNIIKVNKDRALASPGRINITEDDWLHREKYLNSKAAQDRWQIVSDQFRSSHVEKLHEDL